VLLFLLDVVYYMSDPSESEAMRFERRDRKSRFIHLNNTAKPGLVCGPFWAISYYIGCPFKCSYCYLQGTFRGKVDPVVYTNREKLLAELDEWLARPGNLRLNAGEVEDSLALDGLIPLVDDLVPRFAAQQRHKLLLVTKSTNIGRLLKHDPKGQVIVAFSVNAPSVSERFELGAPHPLKRAEAAARVKDAGYYVTLRLDPMIPVERWQASYCGFIDEVYEIFRPAQWTLGSLRYFPTLPMWTGKVGRDRRVYDFPRERSPEDGRWRIPLDMRAEMYGQAMGRIRRHDSNVVVRLCKETEPLYHRLGLQRKGCCYLAAMRDNDKDVPLL
jgi:DNA repair photolyase